MNERKQYFNVRIYQQEDIFKYPWSELKDYLKIKTLESQTTGEYLSDSNLMEHINAIKKNEYIDSHYRPIKPAMFIYAPTGCGKTTFIINALRELALEHNKYILLLVNRDSLLKQIKLELLKVDSIMKQEFKENDSNINWLKRDDRPIGRVQVMTYQDFWYKYCQNNHHSHIDIEKFEFLVCDEAHYFLDDSKFNFSTEDTLHKLISMFKGKIRLYFSATPNEIIPVIALAENEAFTQEYSELYYCPDYRKSLDENEGVRLYYYGISNHKDVYVYDILEYNAKPKEMFKNIMPIIIKAKDNNEKTIIFVDSKKFGQTLCECINLENNEINSVYIDSNCKHTDTYRNIVEQSMFDEDVLITTSILDNGVNLIDDKLTNIIVLQLDAIKYVQSIGRKRTNDNVRVNIWLTKFTPEYLRTRIGRLKTFLCQFDDIKRNPEEYCALKSSDSANITFIKVLYTEMLINNLAKKKAKFELAFLENILSKMESDPDACIKAQLELLHAEDHYEHLGYSKAEWALYQRLNELIANKGYYIMRREELCKFKDMLDEFLGKSNTERPDRDFSWEKAANRLIRHNLPFILEEKGDYITLIKIEIPSEEGESE